MYIYNFENLELIEQYDVGCGPVALHPNSTSIIAAFPTLTIGEICILTVDTKGYLQTRKVISGTMSPIVQLAFDAMGTKLALSSKKGTLIRILDLTNTKKNTVSIYRRATQQATIQSLAFSPDSMLLACTSSSQIIHVFHLDPTLASSYFGEWFVTGEVRAKAVASYDLPGEQYAICTFIPSSNENTLKTNLIGTHTYIYNPIFAYIICTQC